MKWQTPPRDIWNRIHAARLRASQTPAAPYPYPDTTTEARRACSPYARPGNRHLRQEGPPMKPRHDVPPRMIEPRPMTPLDLAVAMHELNMSQARLARLLGVDVSTVRYWQSGRGVPAFAATMLRLLLASREARELLGVRPRTVYVPPEHEPRDAPATFGIV